MIYLINLKQTYDRNRLVSPSALGPNTQFRYSNIFQPSNIQVPSSHISSQNVINDQPLSTSSHSNLNFQEATTSRGIIQHIHVDSRHDQQRIPSLRSQTEQISTHQQHASQYLSAESLFPDQQKTVRFADGQTNNNNNPIQVEQTARPAITLNRPSRRNAPVIGNNDETNVITPPRYNLRSITRSLNPIRQTDDFDGNNDPNDNGNEPSAMVRSISEYNSTASPYRELLFEDRINNRRQDQ